MRVLEASTSALTTITFSPDNRFVGVAGIRGRDYDVGFHTDELIAT
jgi:hypothetical protein